MVEFTATLLKFDKQGEKTGWTYIEIPAEIAGRLKPGNKKSFRVKGKLDNYKIRQVALLPMGGGGFIMAINAQMRKGIGKRNGAMIRVQFSVDSEPIKLSSEFMECLADEPAGLQFFNQLPQGHQNYFSKWIESAKTEQTRTKRISMAINALARKMGFGEMLREQKQKKNDLGV
jgi:hypothetical protein